ncbi:MAG TPA: efflux transporter outer membrane subunit [Gammaproteobacteria bacterium]|nr:efflux transporter outer membrane subunit [Gammaproteobacteria bacterium]HRP85906.1 efflux transporter outer membrane subunit [Gammaproteobacteria bacterium]
MVKAAMVLLAAAALAGCAVGPDYQAPQLELPEHWPDNVVLDPASGELLAAWWRRFEDPVLDGLIERALADNLQVRMQAARVEEARARLGLARAEQWPTVGLQAEAARQRQPAATFGIAGLETPPRNLFSISGVLGYEIDLWGRLAREREAAMARLQGSLYAQEAVRLGVIADVAVGYFNLRSAQRQLDVTERTLAARLEGVRIERLRFEAGQIDELAYREAESQLAGTRAELPGRISELRRRESALGLLLGLSPEELLGALQVDAGTLGEITLPAGIPAHLPSTLLVRRPDVRAAEAELAAATAGIGVAQAARLPQFNLAGLLGTAAGSAGDLFGDEAQAWSIGTSIGVPLLDFGRGRTQVETAEAQRLQAEMAYRSTVANAFVEVRDALVFYESSGARLAAIDAQVQALKRTEELAGIRYRDGYVSIIELLAAQRALLAAELALAQAEADRLAAAATLFKALGGGWEAKW